MNPDEIRYFAGMHLEPRLPRLKRRDLAWAEPSDDAFVCPIEFVAVPVGWIKCSLTLIAPPRPLGRETHILVGVRAIPLYCPEAEPLDVGVKRGHGWSAGLATFRHRWPIGPGAGDEAAAELARSIEEQWPAAIRKIGTPSGVAREVRDEASRNLGWLETLAYSRILAGDDAGAADAIRRILRNPSRTGEMNLRATQIAHTMESDPGATIEMLLEFRRRRLALENLLELAAPLAALESPTRPEPTSRP
jgi:hypothetical protein